jgi:hypothetical protein
VAASGRTETVDLFSCVSGAISCVAEPARNKLPRADFGQTDEVVSWRVQANQTLLLKRKRHATALYQGRRFVGR